MPSYWRCIFRIVQNYFTRQRNARPRSQCLSLEALEDRCVPSRASLLWGSLDQFGDQLLSVDLSDSPDGSQALMMSSPNTFSTAAAAGNAVAPVVGAHGDSDSSGGGASPFASPGNMTGVGKAGTATPASMLPQTQSGINLTIDPSVNPSGAVAELINAITTANTTSGGATINLFPGGVYKLEQADNFWYGPDGLPAIFNTITIAGDPLQGGTIERDPALGNTHPFRIFYVGGGISGPNTRGSLTLQNLTVMDGLARGGNGGNGSHYGGGGGAGLGGAIFNQGSVMLQGVTLSCNQAVGGKGGSSTVASPSCLTGGGGGGGLGGDGGVGGVNGGGGGGGMQGTGGSCGGNGGNFMGAEGGSASGAGGVGCFGGNGAPGGVACFPVLPCRVGYGGGGGGFGLNQNGCMVNGGGLGGTSFDNPNFGVQGDGGGGGIGIGSSTLSGAGGGAFGGGGGGGGGDGHPGGGGGIGGGGGGGAGGCGGFGGGGGGAMGGFGGGGGGGGGHWSTFGGGAAAENTGSGSAGGGGGAGLGGAIFNHLGSFTAINSTITANTAQGGDAGTSLETGAAAGSSGGSGFGGGIFNLNGTLSLTNDTIAANSVAGGLGDPDMGFTSPGKVGGAAGGAVYNLAFGNNYATGANVTASAVLVNNILSNSSGGKDLTNDNLDGGGILAPGPNTATVDLSAHNLVMTKSALDGTSFVGTPVSTADPLLGPPLNNGGPTPTMMPGAGSPALGAGTTTGAPNVDQRGDPRPDTAGPIDIGSVQVSTVATSTTLTSSLNPSGSGQSVTFTAKVALTGSTASASSIQGTVTFFDGSATLGTVNVVNGSAAFPTSSLTAGSHTITATYNPAGGFTAKTSTSTPLTQVVQAPPVPSTTTTLSSSLNPSVAGQAVTFTAMVAVNGSTAPASSIQGTVTFFDGSSSLGTANVVNGSASYSTSSLTVGSHTITATYNPAVGFNASSSTSAPLTQVVQAAPVPPPPPASAPVTFFTDGSNQLFEYSNGTIINTGVFAAQLATGTDAAGNPECWFIDGNNQLYRLDNGMVTPTGAFATRLAPGQGMVAFTDGNNQIWILTDAGTLTPTPGFALQLSTGSDASGNNQVAFIDGDHQLYLLDVARGQISNTGAYAQRVSEGRDAAGNVETYFTDALNHVWRLDAGALIETGTFATQLVGGQSQVFYLDGDNALVTLPDGNTYGTYLYGSASQLVSSASLNGFFFLDGNGQLWLWQNGQFTNTGGFGSQLSAL